MINIETGEVRKDRQSGETVWSVGLCAMRGRDSSVIRVDVVGEPQGLSLMGQVRVVDLEAVPWERDGRSGVSWRAGAVEPAGVASNPGSGSAAASAGSAGATESKTTPPASGRRTAGDAA